MEEKHSNEDVIMKDADAISHSKKMELLDKMMDEIDFSDSDDDEKKEKKDFILDEKTYTSEMSKINKLYEQNQEEGVDDGTMNKYTGTRHEIINEKERKDYPPPFEVTIEDKFEECGTVKNIIENEILMTCINNNVLKVLNLDNIIFLSDKTCIGFIDDVIGQINNPVYAIKLYPNLIEQKIIEKINIGDKLFFCSNRANVINAIELKNKSKGCDASNAFDEEVSEDEQDYSDDEEEVQAKIRRKKNKKRKIEENINTINNNINNQINMGNNINQGNIINVQNSSSNPNMPKKDLNEKMDIFINNAMNMNINPFASPFDLNGMNMVSNGGDNSNNNNNNL